MSTLVLSALFFMLALAAFVAGYLRSRRSRPRLAVEAALDAVARLQVARERLQGAFPAPQSFTPGPAERAALGAFQDAHRALHAMVSCGAGHARGGSIGGRFTYMYTPTALGVVVRVRCACGVEEDVTEYGSW